MDPELKEEAAEKGDVEFLRKAVAEKPSHYFLTQTISGSNIFHTASRCNQVEFVRTAMEILPTEVILQLLSQKNSWGETPLHTAARWSAEMVKVMLAGPPIAHHNTPWWLAVDEGNWTVLHSALYGNNEEGAMEILSMPDIELIYNIEDDFRCSPLFLAVKKGYNRVAEKILTSSCSVLHSALYENKEESAMGILSMGDSEFMCSKVDRKGNSPLFLAVKKGFNRVAEKILTSSCSYSLSGENCSTALHFAPNTSENVLTLLLQKHPEVLDVVNNDNYTVLHQWVKLNEVWPFELLLRGDFSAAKSKVFRDLIYKVEKNKGRSPLHFAAKMKPEIGRAIIDGYEQEMKAGENSLDVPWKIKDKAGDTPLHVAIKNQNQEFALYLLSLDPTLSQARNHEGCSPLYVAVLEGCDHVIEDILTNHGDCFSMLRNDDGTTVLHLLKYVSEKIGRKLIEKYWWMISLPNNIGRTALHVAKQANIPWFVHFLEHPSTIKKEPFNWIKACEREEDLWALFVFIDHYQDDLQNSCRELIDTPLHHIKLQAYGDYVKLLTNPYFAELKNAIDFDGATPLHRALERKDMNLAKALLVDSNVDQNIKDRYGRTIVSLLAELCRESKDWETMCNQLKIYPLLRTSYVGQGTILDQIRNTLKKGKNIKGTISNLLHKLKSFLKKKTFISSRNPNQKDGLPLSAKEKESTSENDDSQATEGTSSKLVQYSNSFTRKKFAIPTEIQDEEDQIRSIEEGQAFTYRNDDARATGSTASNPFQRSVSF